MKKEKSNKIKRLSLGFISLILILSLTACGKSAEGNYVQDGSSDFNINSFSDDRPVVYSENAVAENGEFKNIEKTGNQNGQNGQGNETENSRKIVRNASLEIKAGEGEESILILETLTAHCVSLGGYEFSNETSNRESYSTAFAVLKIPPEKLDEFLEFAKQNTDVVNLKVDSEDVTDSYYDISIRLETKLKSLDSYYKLLENANSVENIISIQRTIDDLTAEIESLKGRLKVMDSLVDSATVTLRIEKNIAERREVTLGALTVGDMGYFIKNGFVGVVNVIVGFFQWAVIILATTSPVLIPVIIITVILIRRSKKARDVKRQRLEAEQMANATNTGNGGNNPSEPV